MDEDDPYAMLDYMNDETLRKLQFLNLCQRAGVSSKHATDFLRFFKSIGQGNIEALPWTFDTLRRGLGRVSEKDVQVKKIRISRKVRKLIGGPETVDLV